MPVSGSDVLRELQTSLDDVRQQAADSRTAWQRLDGRMDELIARRAEAILEQTRDQLPESSCESIAQTLSDVQGELQSLLERKDLRVDELTDQLDQLDAEREQTEHDLDVVTGRLNEKVRARDELQQTVSAALRENVEYRALSKQAVEAEAGRQPMGERDDEVTDESARELPANEHSRLFRYLRRRGYGTDDYRHGGLMRQVDRWVARLIDFDPDRKSDELPNHASEVMGDEVARDRSDFNGLTEQVAELRQVAADAAGLTKVMKDGASLGAERDALVAKRDHQTSLCRKIEDELLKLQQSQGEFYERALARLRTFLTETETAVREHPARQTRETTDDEVVTRITSLREEIREVEPGIVSLQKTCDDLDQQSAGLEFVVQQYRQANFDSQRSYFDDGFSPREVIERFRKHSTSNDDLWESIRQRQQFEPTWTEPSASEGGQTSGSAPRDSRGFTSNDGF